MGNMSPEEINRILQLEGGETTLLKREGGSASGEREKWYIRAGNHATLVELFKLRVPVVFLPLPVHLVPSTADLCGEEAAQRIQGAGGDAEEKRQAPAPPRDRQVGTPVEPMVKAWPGVPASGGGPAGL